MRLAPITKESFQLRLGVRAPGVGESLELAQVSSFDGTARQQSAGMLAALIEQFRERVQVSAGVGEVGEPVQRGLVALVREPAKGVFVEVVIGHVASV